MTRLEILGGVFDCVTREETIDWAREWIHAGKRGYVCTVNAAILMMMRKDPTLRDFVESSSLTVADGQPLVWYSRLSQAPLPERVTGVDLVGDLCELSSLEGFKVYLLGAKSEVVHDVASRLERHYVGLNICGIADGYFGEEEAADRARAVADSGADLLITGMGVPRQEQFIADHWETLNVKLAIPVGGSFEVIAGQKKRAPDWVQRTGFEWFYRFIQEPGRLWRRYLVTNSQFLWQMAREAMRGGPRPASERADRTNPTENLIGKSS